MREVLPAGHGGLLVECADLTDVMNLHRALEASRPAGVVDIVPAARTVLVTLSDGAPRAEVVAAIHAVDTRSLTETADRAEVVVPVTYDGGDLEDVAELTGIPVDEVVRRHAAADYVVAFTGFAPGFAYIAGGDPALHVPRRATPRTRVPAGSVSLAGEFTGIYPRVGPGGWQLIGRTDVVLWDLQRESPALLTPGTPVRFEAVTS
ncbi:5-oxoprolinase subunit B family protein [Knoellia subterranea]|uniref:Allophanate hydrolase n=1 Tax=Knoellia subterranea KCTC 19937 TaxID=1385521 RepID=A0A0A0JK22_9MICO|nr:allophanate hydrolase subunit 1 [Knoellia subterranea]KGN37775.1 allophanate hydrolase [Knoellia subterranea KCTC 19937]